MADAALGLRFATWFVDVFGGVCVGGLATRVLPARAPALAPATIG
jgi:hypothetical protein